MLAGVRTGELPGDGVRHLIESIARTIGSGIGTAVVAAVITSHSTAQGLPTDDAFTSAFWVCAGVAVLAILAALALPSARHRREQALAAGIDDLPPEPVELHLPHRDHADEGARA